MQQRPLRKLAEFSHLRFRDGPWLHFVKTVFKKTVLIVSYVLVESIQENCFDCFLCLGGTIQENCFYCFLCLGGIHSRKLFWLFLMPWWNPFKKTVLIVSYVLVESIQENCFNCFLFLGGIHSRKNLVSWGSFMRSPSGTGSSQNMAN